MPHQPSILIIDDDRALVEMVTALLRANNFSVFAAYDGLEGLDRLFELHPDLIILDITMPLMDGWAVCQRVREVSNVPILMLTALSTPETIVKGLEMGADDYILKPCNSAILLARVQANLRRAASEPTLFDRDISYRDSYLTISVQDRRVTAGGQAVKLTPTEFNVLLRLVENAPRTVPYRDLLEQVWGFEYIDAIDYLRVYIWHLRRKLEPDPRDPRYIINELGTGYRFEARP